MKKYIVPSLAALMVAAFLTTAQAKEIGMNVPSPPLNEARITELAGPQSKVWLDYLARSKAQMTADQDALMAERKGLTAIPAEPATGNGEATMPLKAEAAWYKTAEARAVADSIISYQTPAGGWGKNQPYNVPPRQKGQAYVGGNEGRVNDPANFDRPLIDKWSYVGTTDNGATITEIRYLARVAVQNPAEATLYHKSIVRGIEYLLAAQFPNGGWPQVWPLQGGYHDMVTLNDNAMEGVISLMRDAGAGKGDFAFLPDALKARARAAEQAGLKALLAGQVVIDGKLTLWPQQYDPLTGQPTSARNYEPPSLSSTESAGILMYLMQRPDPSPEEIKAVHAGAAMLKALKIDGYVFKRVEGDDGRRLHAQTDAPPLWSRYYDMKTFKPIFSDRSKQIFDTVDDVSAGRRNGYAWFSTSPQKAIEAYETWRAKHPVTK
ncbi:pectate lyase [Asticcacaulis sp. ZE23SCel15]|uniref:pectate lyase n=1 Tax=Asticcacaulis sp. ZE23SCel15 TaxID=3059027 RepID=UPI00265F5CB5|nr:pectate lyase [Asticcacaulis sp. ZE23SCel15]WKL57138.1 pectate lyase [Asticcacaulis sp. ZE23SCel15]